MKNDVEITSLENQLCTISASLSITSCHFYHQHNLQALLWTLIWKVHKDQRQQEKLKKYDYRMLVVGISHYVANKNLVVKRTHLKYLKHKELLTGKSTGKNDKT